MTPALSQIAKSTRDDDDLENVSTCNKPCCWWNPNQKWISVGFCNETSIHGLKFLGQENRHLSERIFWLIGFFLSFGAGAYLIVQVYKNYSESPVIVSYQSQEQPMDTLPFPAVTLCNMNKFPRSKVDELLAIVDNPNDTKSYNDAKRQLKYVDNACNSQQSFAKEFFYAFSRGRQPTSVVNEGQGGGESDRLADEDMDAMNDFIIENTLACDKLVRLCLLGEEPVPCGNLFKPIITDFGKCCTFNILPLPLLLKNPASENKPDVSLYDNPVLGTNPELIWPKVELDQWSKWDYDKGFVLNDDTEKPWRQRRPGLPYGLSILVDPNLDDYFCPASDSVGVRYILHTPLEMPQVMAFSSVATINKEVVIEVHPDMKNADDDIRGIQPEDRECYFGREKLLKYYRPYTGGNCVQDCAAEFIRKECHCAPFHMPREAGVKICNSNQTSPDYKCVTDAKIKLQGDMHEICTHCGSPCEDIEYNYETTIADIQPPETLWGDPDLKRHPSVPEWANHSMSIIHIFFGAESTVPKFRQRMYGITDLIANTGGILGLCLGFSILSGVEVFYFLTLRAGWRFCRKRQRHEPSGRINKVPSWSPMNVSSKRVINLNPERIPVFARNTMGVNLGVSQYVGNTQRQYYGATSFFKTE